MPRTKLPSPLLLGLPLLLLLVAPEASSSPRPTPRLAPLLIAQDRGAERSALRLQRSVARALDRYPELKLRNVDELLGMPAPKTALAALKQGRVSYTEGRRAFVTGDNAAARRHLRRALTQLSLAAPATPRCTELCDALAMYAALQYAEGDIGEARFVLLDLNALAPSWELAQQRFTPDFRGLFEDVRGSREASYRGTISVTSEPTGARVLVDGEQVGFTPVRAELLAAGRHLVRVETPGYERWGAVVELDPEGLDLEARLSPTEGMMKVKPIMRAAADEVRHGTGSQALSALGARLGLDWAVLGTVKSIDRSGEKTEVILGVFDLERRRRLSRRKAVFQGDEYGQLDREVAKLVNHVIVGAFRGEQPRRVESTDPLDGKDGIEGWDRERRRRQVQDRRTREPGEDPLDSTTGMEDW